MTGLHARDAAVLHAVSVPESAVVDALQALAAAAGALDVAEAVCPVLAALPGVRAAALVRRDGRGAVVVVGSSGYDCGTLAAGARLPLDAGLPVTEAVRTGAVVRQGTGPSWCAVPFGRDGAVLLSCDAAPPQTEVALARVGRVARAAGTALTRIDAAAEREARLTAGLARPVAQPGVRQVPLDAAVGGDVVVDQTVGGTRWLVVADVCGSGLAAAPGAMAVRAAVRALLPHAAGPAHLLAMLDGALRPEVGPDAFVTAVAVAVDGTAVRAASAGQPPPVVVADRPTLLPVVPGPPLALCTQVWPGATEHEAVLPPEALLVLYTDGLTDNRTDHELDPIGLLGSTTVGSTTAGSTTAGSPDALADELLAAADAVGPAVDDVTVLVAALS